MTRMKVKRTFTPAGFTSAGRLDCSNGPKRIPSLLWLAFAVAALVGTPARAQTAGQSSSIKVMTQNIDEGTDETFIVTALFGYMPLPEAVDITYAELQASRLKGRAELIAGQIVAQKPDIVALEEVALWRTGPDPQHAVIPLYDQLKYIVDDLGKLGAPYLVAGVDIPEDIALAGNKISALRLTERNVLLVRAEFRWPPFYVSDVQSHVFSSVLTIGTLQIPAGWISATVHAGGKQFILAMAHLESTVPGTDSITVQEAQAQELIQTLSSATVPVLLCGDFNSDANDNPAAPDPTPTADMIQAAGYTDVWKLLHSGDPGNTWPLYSEDLLPISFPAQTPVERIDLFFIRGMSALTDEQVIAPAPAGFSPPDGSDHAGMVATFVP